MKLNYTIKDLILDWGSGTNYEPYTSGENINCYVNEDQSVRRCIDSKLINITASVEVQ